MAAARLKLILGLGNPGERYRRTRHNVGFRVVEELARRRSLGLRAGECNAVVGGDEEVFLAMPQTYMNRSGYTARCLMERRGFEPAELLVVFDEVNLPLGRLRLRPRGSPGGHRGMESVLDSLQSDEVPRLRLGVGGEPPPAAEELADFVLEPFAAAERQAAEELIQRGADACEHWLRDGIEVAMNRFNG
jgi:peptidyl-tRNA hydrolase, PTH1 family